MENNGRHRKRTGKLRKTSEDGRKRRLTKENAGERRKTEENAGKHGEPKKFQGTHERWPVIVGRE